MSGCVLVVDDDQDLLALMEMVIGEAGYSVRTASDGRIAMARVAEEMPALILLDMRMPVMSGWDFARTFREQHGHAAPIVVVTAAENAGRRAEEIGAEGWLAKPFDIEDVLDAVRRHLGPPAGTQPAP